jgi:uncharacterized protein
VYVVNVLVDGKMRGIFSLMFGAGVVILTARAAHRVGTGVDGADLHTRRMIWLMLFGIAHAYLLGWGEILSYWKRQPIR